MKNQSKIKNDRVVSITSSVGTAVPIEESIISPRKNDIILGRGNGVKAWRGNTLFHSIILDHRNTYQNAAWKNKASIAHHILQDIMALDPPGRFIEKKESNRHFSLVPYHRALEKTCQALREKRKINPPKIGWQFEFDLNNNLHDQNNVLLPAVLYKTKNGNHADGTVPPTNQEHHQRTMKVASQPPHSTHQGHYAKGIFVNHSNDAIGATLVQRNENCCRRVASLSSIVGNVVPRKKLSYPQERMMLYSIVSMVKKHGEAIYYSIGLYGNIGMIIRTLFLMRKGYLHKKSYK